MRVCWAVLVAGGVLSLPAVAQNPKEDLRRMERLVFAEVNRIRAAHDLKELKWDDDLAGAARAHALNMAARRFFSHFDPVLGGFRARLAKRGIQPMRGAENIFTEEGYKEPAPVAVKEWMASPGHRRNILGSFTHTGTGVAVAADGKRYFVQMFSTPRRTTASSR